MLGELPWSQCEQSKEQGRWEGARSQCHSDMLQLKMWGELTWIQSSNRENVFLGSCSSEQTMETVGSDGM